MTCHEVFGLCPPDDYSSSKLMNRSVPFNGGVAAALSGCGSLVGPGILLGYACL